MTVLFAAAIFLNSALLFWLEPLFGKTVLPLLGGTPGVWNVCLLFYQTALLAGYAWAHAADKIGVRRHALIHLALAIAALGFLPFAVSTTLLPPPIDRPLGWLLRVLVSSVGLPFIVIAANGPLLQRWYSRSEARGARDPYFLYAASNLGSFASLLLFPVVLEPHLTLSQQGRDWRTVYVLTILVAGASAIVLRRASSLAMPVQPLAGGAETITTRRKLYWLALAAIPSSLMLGVTTYIAAEVASIPLVWIVPLALYLATLVAAYGATDRLQSFINSIFSHALTPAAAARTLGALIALAAPSAVVLSVWDFRGAVVVAHLTLFTVAALICHVQLAADRPSAAHLTAYYLWSAAGGAVGGAFNALIGPALFTSVLEYPVALTAVLTVLPTRGRRAQAEASDFAWAAGVGVATLAIAAVLRVTHASLPFSPRLLLGVPALACLSFSGRPLRFGAGLVAVVLASAAFPSEIGDVQYASRNFFGVHRVLLDQRHGFRWLTHGVTVHGGERLRDSLAPKPLTYYSVAGPLADVFRSYGVSKPGLRVGVIGLGAGSMLFYGLRDQDWTFYEIDPAVTQIAQTPRFFGFLGRARAHYRVIGGDARLSLAAESSTIYDMLVLDAFSSDAIPTHLLTREAVRLYLSRLAPGGVLVMHISNRFFNLAPVVAGLADDARLAARIRVDETPDDAEDTGKFGSRWVVLTREATELAPLAAAGWQPLTSDRHLRVWTDDYSSVLPLMRRGGE